MYNSFISQEKTKSNLKNVRKTCYWKLIFVICSYSTWRFKDARHVDTWPHKHARHVGTWARKHARHVGTRARKHARHVGTWARKLARTRNLADSKKSIRMKKSIQMKSILNNGKWTLLHQYSQMWQKNTWITILSKTLASISNSESKFVWCHTYFKNLWKIFRLFLGCKNCKKWKKPQKYSKI